MAKRTAQVGKARYSLRLGAADPRTRRNAQAGLATDVAIAPSLRVDRRGRLSVTPATVVNAGEVRAERVQAPFAVQAGEPPLDSLDRLMVSHQSLQKAYNDLLDKHNAMLDLLSSAGFLEAPL